MSIMIGNIKTRNNVFLAPMSGVTDEPFRAVAHNAGAGLVVSEMVASEEMMQGLPEMRARAELGLTEAATSVQIAGREAYWMAEAAKRFGVPLLAVAHTLLAMALTMGLPIQVANPNHEAWRWKNVKRKTDKDDALKLAQLSAMNQLPTLQLPSEF